MVQQKATNVTWHDGEVTRDDRNKILGQKGATLWFTGLSGSGKSTVAVALEQALAALIVLTATLCVNYMKPLACNLSKYMLMYR